MLANGVPQPVENSGQMVTVFARQEMDTVQGDDLARLLERSPGVAIARAGGPGAVTGMQVRGAESDQLLVLVDGVRMADPAAPGGGFDLGNLMMGGLARIELLRGSNSTIWGSQALGGVMAATTQDGRGVSGSIEYGAYDTLYITGTAAGAIGPARVGLEAARFTSTGFSSAARGTEPDGFRQTEVGGHASLALGGGWSAFARGRFARGHLDIDGYPPPDYALADTVEYQDTRQLSGIAGLRYQRGTLDITLDGSAAQTRRANFDPALGAAPDYTTNGVEQRVELRGRWGLGGGAALDFGGEREWTRFASSSDPRQATAVTGAYAQVTFERGPLHLTGGARHDTHRDFGGQWSPGADAALSLTRHWRLTASYGEGFKAPTLFQLHSDYGNALLQPERSRSLDAGIAYRGNHWDAQLTAFRRDTRALIGFVSCYGVATGLCANRPFGTYDNVGRTRGQGVEFSGRAGLSRALSLSAGYTYLDARDRTPGSPTDGKRLPRRPDHAATLSADWARGPVRLGVDARIVSRRFEDAANAVRLSGYGVGTLRGEVDASRSLTVFGRIENVTDAHYQTAAGYAQAGRSAYVGARARL